MLPFMQPKKITSMLMAKTKPEGGVEEMPDADDSMMPMHSAASDLLSAIETKDVAGIAEALSAAHDIKSGDMGDSDEDDV